MKYLVRVKNAPRPRKVNGKTVIPEPELLKEFSVTGARTVDAVREIVKNKIRRQENIFKGKELRSICFSPVPEPHGSVLVYVQPVRDARGIASPPRDVRR